LSKRARTFVFSVKPTESNDLFAASDAAAPNMQIEDEWYFCRRFADDVSLHKSLISLTQAFYNQDTRARYVPTGSSSAILLTGSTRTVQNPARAVFNALPIYPLDGGRMFNIALKSVMGGRGREKLISPMTIAVTATLVCILLMIVLIPFIT